jgi:WD40 repeat protein
MEANSGFKVFTIPSGDEYLVLPCSNMADFGCDGPFGTAVAFDTEGQTIFLTTTYGDNRVHSWDLTTLEETILGDEATVIPNNLIYAEDRLIYFALGNRIRFLGFDGEYDDYQISAINSDEPEILRSMALHPAEPILAVMDKPIRKRLIRVG